MSADCRVSIKALEAQSGLPHTVVHDILKKDLKLQRKAAKFVSRVLTPNHLRQRLEICQQQLKAIQKSPEVLKRIVTTDESWVYMYDPELKSQSSQWLGADDPRKKLCMQEQLAKQC